MPLKCPSTGPVNNWWGFKRPYPYTVGHLLITCRRYIKSIHTYILHIYVYYNNKLPGFFLPSCPLHQRQLRRRFLVISSGVHPTWCVCAHISLPRLLPCRISKYPEGRLLPFLDVAQSRLGKKSFLKILFTKQSIQSQFLDSFFFGKVILAFRTLFVASLASRGFY